MSVLARLGRSAPRAAGARAREHSANAPIGGWNTRDSFGDMDPRDAVVLDNFFPGFGNVSMRKGFAEHATGIGSGDVEWAGEYHSGSARKLLAAGGGGIYDASAAGAATSLKTGFSSNRWYHANMLGKMGLVNGADAPQVYDGSTVSAMTISGSGLTASDLIGVNVFKSRSYFWEDNSQDFWYSATNTLGGSLTKFPLGDVGQFGGRLLTMATWTTDAGDGADDYAVFVMSSGQIVVYQGSNPGDASNWSLVGIYDVGEPLAQRGVVKFGGDLLVMTNQDYISLSDQLRQGRQRRRLSKLSGAAIDAAKDYGDNYGWQAFHYPQGNMILFNVPVATNSEYQQHVVNAITGAPCRFTGINARIWALYNGETYFGGGGGKLFKFDTGTDDDGANIVATMQTAWNDMGAGGLKHWMAVRPILSAPGDLTFGLDLAFDFGDVAVEQTTSTFSSGPEWDVAEWDVAEWAPELTPILQWRAAQGVGRKVSLKLRIELTGQTPALDQIDYRFAQGAGL